MFVFKIEKERGKLPDILNFGIEYTAEGKKCAGALGIFKTLRTDNGAMHITEGIAYVTKIENYPEKCFYWKSGKEPLYFESKRAADDYAFGLLLNGCLAVVMEVPKAIIINNIKNQGRSV